MLKSTFHHCWSRFILVSGCIMIQAATTPWMPGRIARIFSCHFCRQCIKYFLYLRSLVESADWEDQPTWDRLQGSTRWPRTSMLEDWIMWYGNWIQGSEVFLNHYGILPAVLSHQVPSHGRKRQWVIFIYGAKVPSVLLDGLADCNQSYLYTIYPGGQVPRKGRFDLRLHSSRAVVELSHSLSRSSRYAEFNYPQRSTCHTSFTGIFSPTTWNRIIQTIPAPMPVNHCSPLEQR